ncbi:MAG: hypothetical protein WAM30_01370 [Candidatus Dormiibacterota bacterium]
MKYPENAPIACGLDDLKEREQAWSAVIGAALRTRTATEAGIRLEFDPKPDAAHVLLDLVTAERDCCAWATWTLTSTDGATVVEASAAEPGPEVLHAMFRLEP